MKSIHVPEINFVEQTIRNKSYELNGKVAEIKSPKSISYVVRWQLAKKRSGSAKTKNMSEISGTTAKPWKQKGTGRARQGSRRSVQFVGGRTCHGPMPRDFDFSIPKKIIKLAVDDVIRYKISSNKVMTFLYVDKKSSTISRFFKNNNIKSALIIANSEDISLSSRNLKNVKAVSPKSFNVLDLLNYEYLIVDNEVFSNKIIGALK